MCNSARVLRVTVFEARIVNILRNHQPVTWEADARSDEKRPTFYAGEAKSAKDTPGRHGSVMPASRVYTGRLGGCTYGWEGGGGLGMYRSTMVEEGYIRACMGLLGLSGPRYARKKGGRHGPRGPSLRLVMPGRGEGGPMGLEEYSRPRYAIKRRGSLGEYSRPRVLLLSSSIP